MSDFASAQYTIDEIKNVLNDQTNGLAAIKSLEGTIDNRLTDNSTGLSALKLAITSVDDKISDATNGLIAIKGLLNTTDGRLTNGTNGLSAIKGAIDTSNNYLSNATYGLSAIKTAATNAQLSVKSVQRGVVTLPYCQNGDQVDAYGANWYGTVNISSVNTSKSIILVDCIAYNAIGKFNSSTQIYLSANISNVSWQVIEFY